MVSGHARLKMDEYILEEDLPPHIGQPGSHMCGVALSAPACFPPCAHQCDVKSHRHMGGLM